MKLLCVLVMYDWLIHNPIALFYNLVALRYTSFFCLICCTNSVDIVLAGVFCRGSHVGRRILSTWGDRLRRNCF